jgi:putative transposase
MITSAARAFMERRTSKTIRVDDGPETVSKFQVQWVHPNGVSVDFYRTGERTDDAFVESFNGSLFEK